MLLENLFGNTLMRILVTAISLIIMMGCAQDDISPPPNILILYIDDMGFNDLGINGGSVVPTPSLDEFAEQGVQFTRHYADSTCSPSRAALMSGRFAPKVGFSPDGPGLSPQLKTLPRALSQLGYSTHHVGKWHMGHINPIAWPDGVGFDTWFGFLSQWLLHAPYQHPGSEDSYGRPSYINPWLNNEKGEAVKYSGHLSDVLTERTVSMINKLDADSSPWFINHWFYQPHTPIQPAKRYADKYDNTPEGKYLAVLNQLDDNVGAILSALDSTEQTNNTLVIIASDNGGTNKNRDNNFPFYGHKSQYFEGALRTPLLVRWPASFPQGKIIGEVVSVIDIMPTILAAADAKTLPELDGEDLTELILSNVKLAPRNLFWDYHVDDRYGFSVLSADGRWRISSFFMNWPHKTKAVLNDLESSPAGNINVAEKYPEIVDSLTDIYRQWFIKNHEVELEYVAPLKASPGFLSGDDLQRSPGFGTYTFALGVKTEDQSLGTGTVLDHPGIWDIKALNGLIKVSIASEELTGELSKSANCQSVIVTANFHRRLTNWKNENSHINVFLYINGKLVDTYITEGSIDNGEFVSNPTYIGAEEGGESTFLGKLFNPLIFNARASDLNYIPIDYLHNRVCTGEYVEH
jgi:arylsulfatase A-like enzyme